MSAFNPGVRRREFLAWAMYDFANSGYTTVILTAVFSTYFVGVVAAGHAWGTFAWTCALSVSYLAVLLCMPWLGARADARGAKRRLLFASTIGCIVATAALAFVGPGAIVLGLVAIAVSNYFYCIGESAVASFLPELARPQALGRVSGWGWGFGYFGGMLTLGIALLIVTRASANDVAAQDYVPWVVVTTCLVFALAAIPAYVFLKERAQPSGDAPRLPTILTRLRGSWRDVGMYYPEFRAFLYCVTAYQAGISVVITLSAVYAEQAMGFSMPEIMMLIFLVNIAAAIGAFAFGMVQDRLGHRLALSITLVGWIVMVCLAYLAVTPKVFWLAATLAGLCMGSSQSAGRAMTGALAPKRRLSEFFALWTFAVQLAAVIGPLSYGTVNWATGGNHRLAILVCAVFFVGGLLLLARVDMKRGLVRQAIDAPVDVGAR